jgi:hypothetical protein
MPLPYNSRPRITLNEDGELEHWDPGGANQLSKTSQIGVRVEGDWIYVGCTKISREAWDYILSRGPEERDAL